MDYKKTNAPATTVTRDMMELCADTGNVYETVAIIGKRANQISVEIKNDLSKKLAEFADRGCGSGQGQGKPLKADVECSGADVEGNGKHFQKQVEAGLKI